MEVLWTAILGAVQGATEFLPVSSSGHLAVGQLLLDRAGGMARLPGQPLLLEILLHLATVLAVLVVYRREVWGILRSLWGAVAALFTGRLLSHCAVNDDANLAVSIVVGTVPTAAIAIGLEGSAVKIATDPVGLGVSFLACACILASTFWWKSRGRRLSWRAALLIGLFQGVAALPGISRSGTTIAVALALGIDREEAARFSFLLSVPAILGAAILEIDPGALAAGERVWAYGAGAAAAFAVGLGALLLLIRVVRRGKMWAFAPYVAAVGVASLALL